MIERLFMAAVAALLRIEGPPPRRNIDAKNTRAFLGECFP